MRSGAVVLPPELGVTPVADRDIAKPPVHNQIDQRRAAQDAVGDEVFVEPINTALIRAPMMTT